MNNVYLLAPLVGLLIFGSVYSKHARAYATRTAEAQQLELKARSDKKAADEAAKADAMESARLAHIRRTEERAAKARQDETEKQARHALEERRDLAIADLVRLRPQLALLQKDFDAMTVTVERSEQRARLLRQREQSVQQQVKQTAASQAALDQLLERLDTVELRRAANRGNDAPKHDRG